MAFVLEVGSAEVVMADRVHLAEDISQDPVPTAIVDNGAQGMGEAAKNMRLGDSVASG